MPTDGCTDGPDDDGDGDERWRKLLQRLALVLKTLLLLLQVLLLLLQVGWFLLQAGFTSGHLM